MSGTLPPLPKQPVWGSHVLSLAGKVVLPGNVETGCGISGRRGSCLAGPEPWRYGQWACKMLLGSSKFTAGVALANVASASVELNCAQLSSCRGLG